MESSKQAIRVINYALNADISPEYLTGILTRCLAYAEKASLFSLYKNMCPDQTSPIVQAGRSIAKKMDAEREEVFAPFPYHNRQHAKEVMLCAYTLAGLAGRRKGRAGVKPLSQQAKDILLTVALFHDYPRTAPTNFIDGQYRPFMQERIAFNCGGRILAAHGVEMKNLKKALFLIDSTDMTSHWKNGALARCYGDCNGIGPDAREAARMLCDADIMGSLVLSAPLAEKRNNLFSQEIGSATSAKAYQGFYNRAVRPHEGFSSHAGAYFNSLINPVARSVMESLGGKLKPVKIESLLKL